MLNDLQKLSLDKSATWQDVKTSYLELMKVWNPDRFLDDENLKRKSIDKSREINRAFKEIKRKLSELNNKNNFDLSKPILSQFKTSTTKDLDQDVPSKEYKQEPLLSNTGVAQQEIEKHNSESNNAQNSARNKISPYLILLLGIFILILIGALSYIYTLFADPKRKIIYGPPADLSKIYKKKVEIQEPRDLASPLDGIVAGQEGSIRIISGVVEPGDTVVEPPITIAASRCDLVAVKKQLSKGVKVNAEDSKGLSALSWASRNGCEDLAKHLIKRGADAKHMSMNGFTPLAWAKWYRHIGVIKVIELRKR